MDTNNISSILEAIAKANEAVKQVPELEQHIDDLAKEVAYQSETISNLNDQINNQQGLLTDRAETIARLEKELSEARFREQAAREASEKSIGTLRDIMEFANLALPVPAKPEVVEEAPKPEPVPLEASPTLSPVDSIETNSTNETTGETTTTVDAEPYKPYAGQSFSFKPYYMANSEWEAGGGQPQWEYQGYASKPSWMA